MAKGELVFKGKDGYCYKRDGHTYHLLEGKSLGGHSTSDICFAIELDDEGGYKDLATWFCGCETESNKLLAICDENITNEPTAEETITNLKEEKDQLNDKISSLENKIAELKEALLIATRKQKSKQKDIHLTRQTFLDVYDYYFQRNDEEEFEEDMYGHDVHVHWHGFWCNCSDGAIACNYIIEGVRGCIEEDDDNY